MAEIKWIKIVTDIFDDEKMLLIETLPEADSIIVIWFKLLCLAGKQNNSGVFTLNGKIPYTDKMLATIFRRKETIVNLALQTFEQFGMIEIINNTITIPNWSKHQNFDKIEKNNEYMKNYMKEYRKKQKLLAEGKQGCKINRKLNDKINRKSNVSVLDKNRIDKNRIDKKNDVEEITKCYEENIGLITPATAELLFDYLDNMDKDLIIKAIKIATINNKRTGRYIQGILNDWNRKGIRTLLDAEKEENEFKNKNKQDKKEETFEEQVERYKREWGVEDED